MATTNIDLTIEIYSEDGSHTQFYQNDEDSISKVLSLLITSRLFTQPLLTLASERSVSTIPCRTIDLILARTPKTPPLLLPAGWLDIVEVGTGAFHNGSVLNIANYADGESLPSTEGITSHLEIHTVGDWMINLRLQTVIQETIQNQHRLLTYFFDLPVIPFRLEAGGVGFLNPAKISRVTMYPAINGVAKTGLPADLMRCVRQ